jgi:hypothetical protein
MGSFNFNLHVKCDDADRVAAAIRRLVDKDHWRPGDEPPEEDLRRYGQASNRRAFFISTPVYGWVSVLDSDIAGAMSLASPLAEELDAFTLLCMVNDSDSWHFVLSRGDGLVAEFDSADEADAADEFSTADLSRIADSVSNLQRLMSDGSLQQRLEQFNQQLISSAPAEIQQCYAKIKQGQASADELQRYQVWAAREAPTMTALVQELMGDVVGIAAKSRAGKSKKRKRKRTKAQRTAAEERLDHLRPLLVAGVTDEQLQEVLDEKAIFAEETLAKFLPLLGIPRFYAYLDYDHKDEASADELAAHGIQFAQHLMFETNS